MIQKKVLGKQVQMILLFLIY